MNKFPVAIQDFGKIFVSMQEKRINADYNLNVSVLKSEVENDIIIVRRAMKDFKAAKIQDRRAFCAYMMIKGR